MKPDLMKNFETNHFSGRAKSSLLTTCFGIYTNMLLKLTFPLQWWVAVGIILALMSSIFTRRWGPQHRSLDEDPSYKQHLIPSCPPMPFIHLDLPVGRACVQVMAISARSFTIKLTPSLPLAITSKSGLMTAQVHSRTGGPAIAQANLRTNVSHSSLMYSVQNLSIAADYIVNLYINVTCSKFNRFLHLCSYPITTLPEDKNFLQNPSFEETASGAYPPSRSRNDNSNLNPRYWTPFYNGGSRRFCETISISQDHVIRPRSGRCFLTMARLSMDWHWPREMRYFGVHQAVPLSNVDVFVASIWYIYLESPNNSAARAVVSWVHRDNRISDGTSIPFPPTNEWSPICISVVSESPIRMAHLFIHLDENGAQQEDSSPSAKLFIDDAAIWVPQKAPPPSQCFRIKALSSEQSRREKFRRHLRARVRPSSSELSVAVPLTADRVLRLETLSKQLGGGAVVAAVAVQSEWEIAAFQKVWRAKRWLREHVDVAFIHRTDQSPLAINALRNIAITLANTTFVVMLDVDMVPASLPFSCLKDGSMLHKFLPRGQRKMLAMNTFFTNVHQRAARDKTELLHMLTHDAGSAYCAGAQKAGRLKTWLWEDASRQVKFQKDYEPYVVARRDEYPEYDERFRGYGFNKIAWTVSTEYAGWKLFTMPQAFVTHLNHPENSWVSNIDNAHYIQTWRRYLAFVAEIADARVDISNIVKMIDTDVNH